MDETNEFLLCDEGWDMSPVASFDSLHGHAHQNDDCVEKLIHTTTNQDCERTFETYLRKEIKYMTRPGYVNFLESNHFVSSCRFKAIQWFIHSQSRLSFGIQSLFNAVNYVDRFIDINQCHGWSHWMMELLSLASLTIAIKFGETGPPKLHKIQEGLEYCFEARLIQKMEYKILECLNWEVNSTTPQSYVELISWKLARSRRLTRAQFIQENLESCNEIIQQIGVTSTKPHAKGDPSSPDTVLTKEQVAIYEDQVDLSFIHGRAVSNKLKRKRKDDYNVKNKQIKCVH
ncbi:putative cyclin-D7-1 [Tanacetum coccineum]